MPSAERRQKKRITDVAEDAFGGDWQVEEWNEGTIVVKNVKCKRSVADHGVVWKECLNMCRLRVALKTSAEKIRNNVVSILSYCITHPHP